jgi:hypothetical protein
MHAESLCSCVGGFRVSGLGFMGGGGHLGEPVKVLLLGGEQHPDVREEPGDRETWVACIITAGLDNAVCGEKKSWVVFTDGKSRNSSENHDQRSSPRTSRPGDPANTLNPTP